MRELKGIFFDSSKSLAEKCPQGVCMNKEKGGITRPKGFFASSLHCGIKRAKSDLCLIFSQCPAKAAGMFTANRMTAAPLVISKRHLTNGVAQAIIANSGIANSITGSAGLKDAEKIAKEAAIALSIKTSDVLVASTGVIGKRLPVPRISASIDKLVSLLSSQSSHGVAKALMTTDTVPKETVVSFKLGGKSVSIGAVAKGAGMIHPDMATMLSFITTDADISLRALRKALKESVDGTFNRITVDGDTSTNDCVFILANGLAGNKQIKPASGSYEAFTHALTAVCSSMAEAIIRDAEGATKFVKVSVRQADSESEARMAAYAIATSLLVKTALYGKDPNWGRVAAAVGRCGADIRPDKLDIYLGNTRVLRKGVPAEADKNTLRKIFQKKDIDITAVLGRGKSGITILTSDLSKKYIDINAHYTT